jgi:hypothetical protein
MGEATQAAAIAETTANSQQSAFNERIGAHPHQFPAECRNMLFPADSDLYPTMANEINSRGQISGMATVTSGKHVGEVHAFVATPIDGDEEDVTSKIFGRGQSSVRPQFGLTPEVRQLVLRNSAHR